MTHTERQIPDKQDVAMFRIGFRSAVEMAERMARRDLRVDLAKKCGYVPAWQRGRWTVADQLADILKEICAADGDRGAKEPHEHVGPGGE